MNATPQRTSLSDLNFKHKDLTMPSNYKLPRLYRHLPATAKLSSASYVTLSFPGKLQLQNDESAPIWFKDTQAMTSCQSTIKAC
eukprot:1141012-Pelagomonas_calceolata.AAC.4